MDTLKIKYSRESDVLLISFKDGIPADSIDLKEGIILHLNHDGAPLELEILDASVFVSLDEFTIAAPLSRHDNLAVCA